jgi:hypothetical protein
MKHNAEISQDKQKEYYDRKSSARIFTPGEEVLVLLPSCTTKLLAKWQGPYKILEKTGPVTYKILIHDRPRKQKVTLHVNLLKKFYRREETFWLEDNGSFHHAENTPDDEFQKDLSEYDLPSSFTEDPDKWKEAHIDPDLNEEQHLEMENLLRKFWRTLQDIPGCTNLAEHNIDTGDTRPIRQKPYRIPFARREAVKKEKEDMLKNGIIKQSESPWASPIVLVPKPDGSWRMCIDFRKLNNVTKFDNYPIPRMDDILDKLGRARYITTLDCCKGYWQIKLNKESQAKSAFITPFGLFEYIRMPMGPACSAATYQRMMDKLLVGLDTFSAAYIDDIIIFSETWPDHLRHVKTVLTRLQQANLTAKPKKCNFGTKETIYLGHKVGQGILRPVPKKIDAVKNLPRPQTKKDVKCTMGLLTYYRKFLKNFATRAAPLYDLLKKSAPEKVIWSPECEAAFHDLKSALTSTPVLRAPDFDHNFIVQTDASERGIGAVLAQQFEDGVHPIAYISRSLSTAETRWAAVERECLAIVWAIKTFDVYLAGREFTLETDNKALKWLMQTREKNNKLLRWSLLLQPYSFKIAHRKGSENANADTLSRIYLP